MPGRLFDSLNLPEISAVELEGINAVQLKFNFPGIFGEDQKKLIAELKAAGIMFQERDEKAAYERMSQTAPDRYVRGDHFDNGERFTPDNGTPNVTVSGLRRDLVNNGFKVTKYFWKKALKNGQVVVVLEYANFKKEGKSPELQGKPLTPEAEKFFSNLIRKSWICHGWNNPNKVDTVNLTGRASTQPAQNRVTAKFGLLKVEPITA